MASEQTMSIKGKGKEIAKDDYPKQSFTYTSANGQQTLQAVYNPKLMYFGDKNNLSEQSCVILDNLNSAYGQSHHHLFRRSLRAAEHQLRSLELQQEKNPKFQSRSQELQHQQEIKTKKSQGSNSLFLKQCFGFLGGEEELPKTPSFSKLQKQFARQNHLEPESIIQQNYIFNLQAISLNRQVRQLLRFKCDQLFSHNEDMMSNLEPSLSLDYKKWLDFYLVLHQAKTFQIPNIPNGIICSDRFSCGEIHRVVRLETQDPQIISDIFEKGFLKILVVTKFDQLRLLPKIIQTTVKEYMRIFNNQRFGYIAILGITSANPEWQKPFYDLYPSVHLIRIFRANAWNSPLAFTPDFEQQPLSPSIRFLDHSKRRAKALNTIRMKLLDRSWFTWGRTQRIIVQTCTPRKDPWISKIDNGHFSYDDVGKEISEINTQIEEGQYWYPKNDEPRDIVYNECHML